MRVTIRVTRTIEVEEDYDVEVDFQDMVDELGIARADYDGGVDLQEYCETVFYDLIDKAGGLRPRAGNTDDTIEFVSAVDVVLAARNRETS